VAVVDSNTHAIRIAHTVGKRKRVLIIAEAEKLQIKVLNAPVVEEETKAEPEQETEKTSVSDKKKEKTAKAKEDKSNDKKSKEKKK
jgi:site-specific DNA-cytosine methylase